MELAKILSVPDRHLFALLMHILIPKSCLACAQAEQTRSRRLLSYSSQNIIPVIRAIDLARKRGGAGLRIAGLLRAKTFGHQGEGENPSGRAAGGEGKGGGERGGPSCSGPFELSASGAAGAVAGAASLSASAMLFFIQFNSNSKTELYFARAAVD